MTWRAEYFGVVKTTMRHLENMAGESNSMTGEQETSDAWT